MSNHRDVNIFSKIFDTLESLDAGGNFSNNPAFFDVEKGSTKPLSGTFKVRSKRRISPVDDNGVQIARGFRGKVKAVFTFQNVIEDAGPIKVRFLDKHSSSLFGDYGFSDRLGNKRKARGRGNYKYDYQYNGKNDNIINNDSKDGDYSQKLAELTVYRIFPNFEDESRKVKGDFRINLDDNFMILTARDDDGIPMNDALIARANFEPNFDLLNPSFELLT